MAETIDPELLKKLLDPASLASLRDPSRHSDLALAESIDRSHPDTSRVLPEIGAAPSLDRGTPATLQPIGGEPKGLPILSNKQQRGLPMISPGITPGTSADLENQLARLRTSDSLADHPTRLGKIGHVLSKIGNVAGDVFAPATMSLIPGTDLNKSMQIHQIESKLPGVKEKESEEGLRSAQKENVESEIRAREKGPQGKEEEWSVVPNVQGPNGEPVQQEKHSGQVRVAPLEGASAKEPKAEKQNDFEQYYGKWLKDNKQQDTAENQLKAHKAWETEGGKTPTGSWTPLYDAQGNVVGSFNAMTGEHRAAGASPMPGKTSQGEHIGSANLDKFNKAYVQPAEAVEKSYQMMDNAYKDYKAAKAAGKDLPTGAESMLALSTHLSTTFGNVKGARITKDMIEHHLGARGISDSAVVAVQKLTNGDVLSPDQWEAFHKLIGESRALSWKTAAKEGKRAGMPIDFLPEDLKESESAVPSFAEFQKSKKK